MPVSSSRTICRALLFFFLMACGAEFLLAQTVSVQPNNGQFANTTVGLSTIALDFIVTNTGSTTLTVESISLSPSEFTFDSAWKPIVMVPKFQANFFVKLAPVA